MSCPFCDNQQEPSWVSCPCPGANSARLFGFKEAWINHEAQSSPAPHALANPRLTNPPTTSMHQPRSDWPQWTSPTNANPIPNAPTPSLIEKLALDIAAAALRDIAEAHALMVCQPYRQDARDALDKIALLNQPGDITGPERLAPLFQTQEGAPPLPQKDNPTRDIGDCGPEASACSTDSLSAFSPRNQAILRFSEGIAATNPDLAGWVNRAATAFLAGEPIPKRRPPKVRLRHTENG